MLKTYTIGIPSKTEKLNNIILNLENILDRFQFKDDIYFFLLNVENFSEIAEYIKKLQFSDSLPDELAERILNEEWNIIENLGFSLNDINTFFSHISSPEVTIFHELYHIIFYNKDSILDCSTEFYCEYHALDDCFKGNLTNIDKFLIENNIDPIFFTNEFDSILIEQEKYKNSIILPRQIDPLSPYIQRYLASWRYLKDHGYNPEILSKNWEFNIKKLKDIEKNKYKKMQKIKKIYINSSDITNYSRIENKVSSACN